MRVLRPALLLIFIAIAGFFLFNKRFATRDERAVLTIVGRSVLGHRTCLAPWTNNDFFSGTYGFGGGDSQFEQAWLDPIAWQARGRSVALYAGAPASKRPAFINTTLDMLVGCEDPVSLSTPIFAGNLAFVSARYSGGGEAYALRRSGSGWNVVGVAVWHNGIVV